MEWMTPISRRTFLAAAAASSASFTGWAQPTPAEPAQTFYRKSDWNGKAFDRLVRARRSVKQLFDVTAPDGENLALHVHNALTGMERGFGIPPAQILMVTALRAGANILNFDDYAWKKYQLGAAYNVMDPATNKPAERNIYYTSHLAPDGKYASDDPDDHRSIDWDWTLQGMLRRGVQMLSCHVATEGAARTAVQRLHLKVSQEKVAQDLAAHMLPGVISVPSMVSAIPVLESHGHFAYLRL